MQISNNKNMSVMKRKPDSNREDVMFFPGIMNLFLISALQVQEVSA